MLGPGDLLCEMCLASGTESLSGGAEGRGCVSSGEVKRRLSESSLKIGRDNVTSH